MPSSPRANNDTAAKSNHSLSETNVCARRIRVFSPSSLDTIPVMPGPSGTRNGSFFLTSCCHLCCQQRLLLRSFLADIPFYVFLTNQDKHIESHVLKAARSKANQSREGHQGRRALPGRSLGSFDLRDSVHVRRIAIYLFLREQRRIPSGETVPVASKHKRHRFHQA